MNQSEIRNIIILRDRECQHCSITIRDAKDWNIDHIIPRSVTAVSHLYNLQLLCPDCNEDKADNPYQWDRKLFQTIRFKSDSIGTTDFWLFEDELQKMYNDKRINKEIWGKTFYYTHRWSPEYHSFDYYPSPKIWSFNRPWSFNKPYDFKDQPHARLFKIIKMVGEKSFFDLKSKHGEKYLKMFIERSKRWRSRVKKEIEDMSRL